MSRQMRKPFKFYCHFCGADETQSRLVCGPAAVAICAICIGRAAAELARTQKGPVVLAEASPPKESAP